MTALSIILLAQQTAIAIECAAAIRKHTDIPYQFIIVNDGCQASIAKAFEEEDGITMISTQTLSGVAAGFNAGAAAATGAQLIFIRDHVLAAPNWLPPLLQALASSSSAALAGPISNGVSGLQNVETPIDVIAKFSSEARNAWLTAVGHAERVTRLLSFLLAANRKAFADIGGFDEGYKLESYEDDDLCYRALRAGYELYLARASAVYFTPPPPLFPDDANREQRQLKENRQYGIAKWGEDVNTLLQQWKRPITVSLCMIVKNEEETLGRCLESVADLVHEINLVDTGSTDRTKEIGNRFGARVFDFEWVNDFAKARNYAFAQATQEYILWLDADDILLADDRDKLKQLIAGLPFQTDVVSMAYHLAKDAYGNVTSSLRRNRLVRRSKKYRWIGVVHEYLEVHGTILAGDIAVTHERVHTASSRNLGIYEAKRAENHVFSARDTYYYANELYDHGQWERAAEQYELLLAMNDVWIEDRIGACGKAAECYSQLKDLHRAKQKALQSFCYTLPRAENCCRLGSFFLAEERYREAVYWYTQATQLTKPTDSNALLLHACWTWLPHIQLCVCYDRIGEYKLAYEANERAAAYLPQDERIIHNRNYLSTKLQDA